MKEEKKKLIKTATTTTAAAARNIPQQPPSSAPPIENTTSAAAAAEAVHHQIGHGGGGGSALLGIARDGDGNNDDCDFDVSAHRSCPDLTLSSVREHRTCLSERGTGSQVIPLSIDSNAANILLPAPKSYQQQQQFLMTDCKRTSKSVDNLREAEQSATMLQISKLLMCKEKSELTNEEFFDLIERLSGNRMPDQRAEFPKQSDDDAGKGGDPQQQQQHKGDMTTESLMQLIAEFQSRRYDDQRASPVLCTHGKKTKKLLRRLSLNLRKSPKGDESSNPAENNEQLYELIMSYQAPIKRLEDQRSELGGRKSLLEERSKLHCNKK